MKKLLFLIAISFSFTVAAFAQSDGQSENATTVVKSTNELMAPQADADAPQAESNSETVQKKSCGNAAKACCSSKKGKGKSTASAEMKACCSEASAKNAKCSHHAKTEE